MGMFQKIKAYLNEDDAEYDALIEEQERMREERRKRRNQSRAERNKEKAKRAAEKAVLKERVDPEIRREVKETVSSNRERKTVGDFCLGTRRGPIPCCPTPRKSRWPGISCVPPGRNGSS